MVVEEILGELTNLGIQVQGYVDDIVLICTCKYGETLCDRIQTESRISSNWFRKAEMRINPTRPNIIPFAKRCEIGHLRIISLQDMEAKRVTKVKYLGITLDSEIHMSKI